MVSWKNIRTSLYVERRFQRYPPVFWGGSITATDGVRKQTVTVRDESLGGLGVDVAPLCGFELGQVVTIQSGMLRRRVRIAYFRPGQGPALQAGLAFLGDDGYR
jgi:hypothetical protein